MPMLFWSKRGEVACAEHAPAKDSPEWVSEKWRSILPSDHRRVPFQCQHCSGRPHRRVAEGAAAAMILNVDDRPGTLYLRDRILREHGFVVVNAESGQQALELARQVKPKLILLDVHLPDADGRELCQRFKADPEFSGIAVLLISATLSGHASHLESIRWSGADGFIREPAEPDALISLVRQTLAQVA